MPLLFANSEGRVSRVGPICCTTFNFDNYKYRIKVKNLLANMRSCLEDKVSIMCFQTFPYLLLYINVGLLLLGWCTTEIGHSRIDSLWKLS